MPPPPGAGVTPASPAAGGVHAGARTWVPMSVPTPPHSGVMCGIGCNIGRNDVTGELFVRTVIPGGPAAFSCEIGVGDVLVAVDGVSVVGETPDEVAKRILGPEGVPITITSRVRRVLAGETVHVDKPVTMIRQPVIPMPERLCEGQMGLGVDIVRLQSGMYQVRKLQSGGAASITGKLKVGDVVTAINNTEMRTFKGDISTLLLGEPYSRVSVTVQQAGSVHIKTHNMVRSVVIIGEYLMKLKAYENMLDHAILIPAPPTREHSAETSYHTVQHVASPNQQSQPQTPEHTTSRQIAGDASCDGLDISGRESITSADLPSDWLSQLGHLREQEMSLTSGDTSSLNTSTHTSYVSSRASNSVDGMVSRSSTASRDSIAPFVRETFGDMVDKLRRVDGREATFVNWPHANNPALCAAVMARAGFVMAPDEEASDKVMCAYCGLELAHWEEGDDAHTAHHDASPGCSFWRKSSNSGQHLSKELFSGYGSPYHSMFRSADCSSLGGLSLDASSSTSALLDSPVLVTAS